MEFDGDHLKALLKKGGYQEGVELVVRIGCSLQTIINHLQTVQFAQNWVFGDPRTLLTTHRNCLQFSEQYLARHRATHGRKQTTVLVRVLKGDGE